MAPPLTPLGTGHVIIDAGGNVTFTSSASPGATAPADVLVEGGLGQDTAPAAVTSGKIARAWLSRVGARFSVLVDVAGAALFPTATASADTEANGTVLTRLGARLWAFNGTTWDRLRTDGAAGNLKTAEAFAPAYEDNTAARALVEQRNGYANVVGAATTDVKGAPGFLKGITVNKAVASATITIYDNTAASGTLIGTITLPATLLASQFQLDYDVLFATGLTVVTTGSGLDITVRYR